MLHIHIRFEVDLETSVAAEVIVAVVLLIHVAVLDDVEEVIGRAQQWDSLSVAC